MADRSASITIKAHPAPLFDMMKVRTTINQKVGAGVLLKTILNRVQKFKGFVYKSVTFNDHATEPTVNVEVVARSNSRPMCSGCGKTSPGYDRRPERKYEFIPSWGIKVFLLYSARRVDCPRCGVRVERLPWAVGKHQLTQTYAWSI
ncbi:MAG: hypothetical protein AB8B97_24675 [Granulosicoccus sp.]